MLRLEVRSELNILKCITKFIISQYKIFQYSLEKHTVKTEEKKEFYRLRGKENNSQEYHYPEISYTLSSSDLLPCAGAGYSRIEQLWDFYCAKRNEFQSGFCSDPLDALELSYQHHRACLVPPVFLGASVWAVVIFGYWLCIELLLASISAQTQSL